MSNVRVTYSGLIAFVVSLTSVLVGMIFVLIITRTLSPEEFGTWSLIGSVLAYFLISEITISFWSTRQIARKKEIGKTAVFSSFVLSVSLIPAYLTYVFLVAETSDVDLEILMLGAILLPVHLISKTISGVNLAHKPQAVSYGLLVYETIKIPIALGLVLVYDLGLYGVITSVLVAYLIRIGIQLYFAKNKLKNQFSFKIIQNWFKMSWVVLYSTLPSYMKSIDVTIFLIITNSLVGLAYYQASLIIANVVLNSNSISQGLYVKLLANGSHDHVKENLIKTLYFAIPLLAISIIFSKPVLFALNPLYQDAVLIVILLSFKSFVNILTSIFVKILKGIEKVDVDENPKFKKLIKSDLLLISTIQIIQTIIYLSLMIIGLLVWTFESDVNLVVWWVFVLLIIETPFMIYWWIKTQKKIQFSFPWKEVTKYSFASLIFVGVYFITSDFLINYEISIYNFLPGLIFQIIICGSLYLGITYIIDKRTRNFFSLIINEISVRK